jgi:hypothetical protein
MSEKPTPPFQSELLPPGGQLAADTFISIVGELAQNQEVPVSYADVIAGLIYATPVIISMSDNDTATELMVKRFQEYVSSDYFPTLVAQWSEFMKQMAEHVADSDSTTSDPITTTDLSKDPRYN